MDRENSEGAKFWLKVMYQLRNRGVGDILIAAVDGLKGFHQATWALTLTREWRRKPLKRFNCDSQVARAFATQVITVGALRPVRFSISARLFDRAIRSASAVCVS